MNRRRFLRNAAGGLSVLGLSRPGFPSAGLYVGNGEPRVSCDVAIIGGGVGGVAAALACLRSGLRVVLSEETDWVGGQLTQQGVPPDENPWIEQFGSTASYRKFRQDVRDYYRRWYPLSPRAASDPDLNPGNCGVSRLCHEPRVALAVLESYLAAARSSGQLQVLLNHRPVQADATGDRVDSVLLENQLEGSRVLIKAHYFVDATETGDLLPLTGTEYVVGAEARSETGEPHAAASYQPGNVQSITWCFALSYTPGADFTIDKPREYDFWRNYRPDLKPPWPGPLLSWTYTHPITLGPFTRGFDPTPDAREPGFWVYRRLCDPRNFTDDRPGITVVNWPQNDYLLGSIIDQPPDETERHLGQSRQLSFSLVYWLQTEAPRPDGGAGWPGLRLRGDLMGTSHGLAKRPYIRESRRIRSEFTVLEQHVGTRARMEATGLDEDSVTAERFPDSVGIGSYRIDLHPSTGGDNYIDISSLPFQIPLGALLPRRVRNLIPACKNIGTTHITNGCYRLHPVEWNIGESAGFLASYCLEQRKEPQQVRRTNDLLKEFQELIQRQGVEIAWPDPLRSPR